MSIAPARLPRRIIPIPPFPPFGIESTHRSSQKIQLPAQYVSVFVCTTLRISTAASVKCDGAHMRKSKDPNSIFPLAHMREFTFESYDAKCGNNPAAFFQRRCFYIHGGLFSLCTARKDTTYTIYKFLLSSFLCSSQHEPAQRSSVYELIIIIYLSVCNATLIIIIIIITSGWYGLS